MNNTIYLSENGNLLLFSLFCYTKHCKNPVLGYSAAPKPFISRLSLPPSLSLSPLSLSPTLISYLHPCNWRSTHFTRRCSINVFRFLGACFAEDINKIEERNSSCDTLGGSFTSHGRNEISTHMSSVQGEGESISCSLSQGRNCIIGNREILEDGKHIKIYQRRKRIKKADLSDLPRTDLESFNEEADSSLGSSHQIMESSSLVQPIEFESVPCCLSSSMSEKRETFENGISTEVVQKSPNKALVCSSEFQGTSLNKYDMAQVGKSDATIGDTEMQAPMLLVSSAENSKVHNAVSTDIDTDDIPGVASKGAGCEKFAVHLSTNEQCLSGHATTKTKSCDADMLVSDHLEELHDEAKETISVASSDALGGVIDVRVDRPLAGYKQKKLLVLDINGLLVDICSYTPYNYDPDAFICNKSVFRRPYCDDFLNFCFEKFNVGFWTSRTRRNLEPYLKFLLGKDQSRLLFHWDQSHCTVTGKYTVEKRNKPLLLKKLKKLWDKREPGLPWEKGVYNESNTLLIDDSPSKALSNPPYTAIFPYSYRFTHVRDNSLGPGGDLRVYLEGLAEAENVQEYVKQNPFGQRAITEKNLSWGYYRKIIEANTTPPRQTNRDILMMNSKS